MLKIDEFVELARSRKSCKGRFKSDPIPDGYIEKILEAARWAMSGANGQPWEFIVVKEQDTKDKIADALRKQNELSGWIETSRVIEMRMPWFRKFPEVFPEPQYRTAPAIIVICADPRASQATTLDRVYDYRWVILENICMATQILHLAVAACGLRSQFVTVNFLTEQLIKPILGIPPIIRIFSLAPIGYPEKEPPRSFRRKIEEFVHYEKYDLSKCRSHADIQEFIRELREKSEALYPLES
jgi:nitroreductase